MTWFKIFVTDDDVVLVNMEQIRLIKSENDGAECQIYFSESQGIRVLQDFEGLAQELRDV